SFDGTVVVVSLLLPPLLLLPPAVVVGVVPLLLPPELDGVVDSTWMTGSKGLRVAYTWNVDGVVPAAFFLAAAPLRFGAAASCLAAGAFCFAFLAFAFAAAPAAPLFGVCTVALDVPPPPSPPTRNVLAANSASSTPRMQPSTTTRWRSAFSISSRLLHW